jgi:hypothetical protein
MKDFENNDIESTERREVLASLMKYSAVVGGASTVVLSASEAVAQSAASGGGGGGGGGRPKGNNGFGNCDQPAPGGSLPNNNAENDLGGRPLPPGQVGRCD